LTASFCGVLLFLFVPETFWDRTPRPKSRRPTMRQRSISNLLHPLSPSKEKEASGRRSINVEEDIKTPRRKRLHDLNTHAHFADVSLDGSQDRKMHLHIPTNDPAHSEAARVVPTGNAPKTPLLHTLNSPFYLALEENKDYVDHHGRSHKAKADATLGDIADTGMHPLNEKTDPEDALPSAKRSIYTLMSQMHYTSYLQGRPPKTFVENLKPWNGRLSKSNWFLVMLRPFILFAYPSVLWSTVVYSLSVGWLIVLSESVAEIYRNKETYNFSALGTGLVYLSPFIGGILGTAVAGKVSDIIVRYMSRQNGGVYEPEFRLVMAAPIAFTTAVGLMGFGWSAEEKDRWIVPTVFFGIISFGCSLGSTTSITFCVDSYRQYAGEALVTLNFSKNVFHGLVFSLFFPQWLHKDGPKHVFLAIGGIQIACLLTSVPMYIYGKRARMWTVRNRWMEKF
jgi:Major Facilitator Superfamily